MSRKKSNIYTRGGDKGETSLLGGRRVPKFHPRIEAYGTVDELIAHTALLRDLTDDQSIREELYRILEILMAAAAILATEGPELPSYLPVVSEEDISFLERSIDLMDEELGPLTNFVLPGGKVEVSQAHVARTICRRAERNILFLAENDDVEEIIIRFINRLSDYYFQIARKLAAINGSEQEPWKP